jgi:hypothetical protein
MPQYYFRVRDGRSLLPDDGASQVFATMEEVREAAAERARQLLSNAVLAGKPGSLDQQIEVMNQTGGLLLTVAVGRAIGTETQT